MLVTVITLLGVFSILVTMMPSGFYYHENKRIITVPEYFESIDVTYYAYTEIVNLTTDSYTEYWLSLGGWNIRIFHWHSNEFISIETYDSWWIFKWNFEPFQWHDSQGVDKTDTYFYIDHIEYGVTYYNLDYAYQTYNSSGKWNLKNSRTQISVYLGFDIETYWLPSQALNAGNCSLLLAVSFDKVNTSINAWNLIGMLLFFQMPNIHPVINAIIAIPLWVAIAYLIYILILKVIPFVGG